MLKCGHSGHCYVGSKLDCYVSDDLYYCLRTHKNEIVSVWIYAFLLRENSLLITR